MDGPQDILRQGVKPRPAQRLSAGLIPHIGVSWPRSGHHLLVRLLQLNLGPDFGYCQHYHTDDTCCGHLPCTRPDVHLSKSHDFAGDLPRLPDQRYLIQFRSFLPSVISDFELVVRGGAEDSRDNFLRHASHRFGAWQEFHHRWVDWGQAQGQLVLHYEKLITDPEAALLRVLAAFAPDHRPDPAWVAETIRRVDGERIERGEVEHLHRAGVHLPRDPREFRHYDPELFALLSRLRFSREKVLHLAGTAPDEPRILRLQAGDAGSPLAPAADPSSF